jgi:hypothetical protein
VNDAAGVAWERDVAAEIDEDLRQAEDVSVAVEANSRRTLACHAAARTEFS